MKSVICLLAVPLLAQQDLNLDSAEKEKALGEQYASEIRRQSQPLADPLVQAYVDRIGRQLVNGLTDQRLDYRFDVTSNRDQTEPFALPGGYVFVPFRIFLVARDEQEFAGTLAHAIGHAALRHGIRTAARTQITNMASIPLIFMGGWTGCHADSTRFQMLVPVSVLESQRTDELEADRFGLELSARAGYDGAAFLRYVERTHPRRDLRISRLQEIVASLPAPTGTTSGDFASIQQRVRSVTEHSQRRRIPTLRR